MLGIFLFAGVLLGYLISKYYQLSYYVLGIVAMFILYIAVKTYLVGDTKIAGVEIV